MLVQDYTLRFQTEGFCHVIDITSEVNRKISQSGVRRGYVIVFVAASTAGVTSIEYEPGVVRDLEELFDRLAPPGADYHHEEAWHDGNGFSHVRASLLKPSLTIPLSNGAMRLGTWQQLVLVDFDNRARNREVVVQVGGLSD